MKKIWFLFLGLISCSVWGQFPVKIYAYSQVEMPGIVPARIMDENGNLIYTKKQPPVNYYIFGAFAVSAKISFTEIRINGNYYKTETSAVDSTPVISINYDIPAAPFKEILVPSTKLRVISITPVGVPAIDPVRTAWFRNMVKHSELIVSYLYKGKKYFIGINKIKKLRPVAGV